MDHRGDSLLFPRAGAVDALRESPGDTTHMIRPFIDRAWHVFVIIGPILAIALALVAARRW